MGKVIIQHIDDAAYLSGEPRKPGEPMPQAAQLIGDLDEGPWIHINSARAGAVAAPHTHDQDEVMLILEGGFKMGAKECGPGTVLFIEKDTQYGFTAGDEGVRFLNIRPGLATFKRVGEEARDPYRRGGR